MSLRALTILPSSATPFANTLSTSTTLAATNYVSFGNHFDQAGSGSFSICGWFEAVSLAALVVPFSKYTAGSGLGYEIQITTTGKIDWSMNNGANFMEVTTASSTIAAGGFHLICIVATGSTAASQTIYVDNVSKSLTTVGNTFSGSMANSNNAVIGYRAAVGGSLYSNNVSFWNKALSAGEVNTIWNGGHPGNLSASGISSLAGWWRMGDGDNATSANGFVDNSGNGLHGTGVNTPTFVSNVP